MESLGYIAVQLLQIFGKGFFQTDMYRSIKILVSRAMKGIFSVLKLSIWKSFNCPTTLNVFPSVYTVRPTTSSPQRIISAKVSFTTTSSLSRAIRPVFIVMPIKAGKSSRMIIRRAAREQCLPALTMNHRTAISANGCAVGTGHRFHVWQSFEELISRVTRRFIIPCRHCLWLSAWDYTPYPCSVHTDIATSPHTSIH